MDQRWTVHEPLEVKRISYESGSHIEPALDYRTSSELEMLRWKAGTFKADTGLTIKVVEYGDGHFGITWSADGWSTGHSSQSFNEVWTAITHMQRGAEFAQAVAKPKPINHISRQYTMNPDNGIIFLDLEEVKDLADGAPIYSRIISAGEWEEV